MILKNIRNILLNYMMSGIIFGSESNEKRSQKVQTKVEGGVFESKNMYITKVTGFLEDGVKQMKKDLL